VQIRNRTMGAGHEAERNRWLNQQCSELLGSLDALIRTQNRALEALRWSLRELREQIDPPPQSDCAKEPGLQTRQAEIERLKDEMAKAAAEREAEHRRPRVMDEVEHGPTPRGQG